MLNVSEKKTRDKKSSEASPSFFDGRATSATPKFDPSQYIGDGFSRWSAARANQILMACRYEHQKRDLSPGGKQHIAVLADIMRRGQWRDKDKLDFARVPALGGHTYILVNGHHRLAAQTISGSPIEWTIVVHECATSEDVAALYYSFDTNLRIRSNAQILGATELAHLLGVKSTAAEALWRAVPLIAADFDFSISARDPLVHRVIDRRMEYAKSFQKEIILWERAVRDAPVAIKRRLGNQGALGVALMTFRHQPNLASDFWGGVSTNDGLRKGDPRHTYLRYLSAEIGTRSDPTTPARHAAVTWNAFFERRSLTIIKVLDNAVFRIAGTPVGRR
jgi:hypothetical protein